MDRVAGNRYHHSRTDGDPGIEGYGTLISVDPPHGLFLLDDSEIEPFKVYLRDLLPEDEALEKELF